MQSFAEPRTLPHTHTSDPPTPIPRQLLTDRFYCISFLFQPSAPAYVLPSHCVIDFCVNTVIDLFKQQASSWTRWISVPPILLAPTPLLTPSRARTNVISPSATIKLDPSVFPTRVRLDLQRLQVIEPHGIRRGAPSRSHSSADSFSLAHG